MLIASRELVGAVLDRATSLISRLPQHGLNDAPPPPARDRDRRSHGSIEEVLAEIDEVEAARVADSQWASCVEARIAKDTWHKVAASRCKQAPHRLRRSSSSRPDLIVVVRVLFAVSLLSAGICPEFKDALARSDLGAVLSASGEEMCPAWANGAKVLVRGLTPEVLERSGVQPSELRPWHVIAHDRDRPRVLAALRALLYEIRPMPKTSACRYAVLRCGGGSAAALPADASTDRSSASGAAATAEGKVEADRPEVAESFVRELRGRGHREDLLPRQRDRLRPNLVHEIHYRCTRRCEPQSSSPPVMRVCCVDQRWFSCDSLLF